MKQFWSFGETASSSFRGRVWVGEREREWDRGLTGHMGHSRDEMLCIVMLLVGTCKQTLRVPRGI